MSTKLMSLARICVFLLLAFSAALCLAKTSSQPSDPCHEELGSIDVNDGGWSDVDNNRYRFKHVFQYKEEYPYFEYTGAVMLGVESSRWYPDSIIPNFNYWNNLDGRSGSPNDNHYSIVDEIYGRGNTQGISFSFSSSGEYAFLLFNRNSDDIKESLDEGALIRHGFSEGTWGVLTFVNGVTEFINVDRRSVDLSCGSSRGYLYFGNHHLAFSADSNMAISHCGAHAAFASNYGHQYLRSVNVLTEKLRIAGVDHTQRKICRLIGIPLAVTNSDSLRPILEEKLSVWADRVHASVVRYATEEQDAEKEKHRTRWVKIAEFSRKSRGNFRQSDKNDVRLEYRNLHESKVVRQVWADGHLIINGVELGKLTGTEVGNIRGLFGRDKQREEVRQKFEAGDFPTAFWTNTSSVYIRDDNRYLECKGRLCSIHVRANKLEEAFWEF